jgi:hypothetical protein
MIEYGVYSNMIFTDTLIQQLIIIINIETKNNRLQLIAVVIKPL